MFYSNLLKNQAASKQPYDLPPSDDDMYHFQTHIINRCTVMIIIIIIIIIITTIFIIVIIYPDHHLHHHHIIIISSPHISASVAMTIFEDHFRRPDEQSARHDLLLIYGIDDDQWY